jgi:adenine phosphoribosyltransferase
VRRRIRDVPDFPRPGIVFKDITPLLLDTRLFRRVTESMAASFASAELTHVVAVESRGFIFGAPIAQTLGVGFVPVRKAGKLPHSTRAAEYALEYGTDRVEIHADALGDGARVLVVDDVLATGGTARATAQLVEELGGRVIGCSFLLTLSFLRGRERLTGYEVRAVTTY